MGKITVVAAVPLDTGEVTDQEVPGVGFVRAWFTPEGLLCVQTHDGTVYAGRPGEGTGGGGGGTGVGLPPATSPGALFYVGDTEEGGFAWQALEPPDDEQTHTLTVTGKRLAWSGVVTPPTGGGGGGGGTTGSGYSILAWTAAALQDFLTIPGAPAGFSAAPVQGKLVINPGDGSGNRLRLLVRDAPPLAGGFTIVAKMKIAPGGGNYNGAGLVLYEQATGKSEILDVGAGMTIYDQDWTSNFANHRGGYANNEPGLSSGGEVLLRFSLASGQLSSSVQVGSGSWLPVAAAHPVAEWFTVGPDKWGFEINSYGGAVPSSVEVVSVVVTI